MFSEKQISLNPNPSNNPKSSLSSSNVSNA